MSPDALTRACYILRILLADRVDVRQSFYRRYGHVAIIAGDDPLTVTPLQRFVPQKGYYNTHAHGLGAIRMAPVASARQNNVLCLRNDSTDEDVMLKVCWYFGRCIITMYMYFNTVIVEQCRCISTHTPRSSCLFLLSIASFYHCILIYQIILAPLIFYLQVCDMLCSGRICWYCIIQIVQRLAKCINQIKNIVTTTTTNITIYKN